MLKTDRAVTEELRLIQSLSHLGIRHSPETIQKMREIAEGRVISPETRDRMRTAHLGKVQSPETRQKLRNLFTGKRLTPEQLELRRKKMELKKSPTTPHHNPIV